MKFYTGNKKLSCDLNTNRNKFRKISKKNFLTDYNIDIYVFLISSDVCVNQ